MPEEEGKRRFADRTALVFVLFMLVSLAFNWYYLLGGFQADDMALVSNLRHDPVPFERWKGLWSEDDIPAFTGMWWKEEGVRAAFWRPIPSLVIEASIRLFGEKPFPLHLLSILLHGCVAFTLYLLVRKLTGKSVLALLAGLFYVGCEDHSLGIGWIATVTDIICVLMINLSLLAHAAWLRRRRAAALVGSLAAMAVAMGSKETAAVAPLVVILMTALMPQGRDAEDGAPFTGPGRVRRDLGVFIRDWLSWAPALALLVVYLGLYKALEPAAMKNLMYCDPIGQPLEYLGHLVLHLPVMWMATVSVMSPSLVMFMPSLLVPLAAAGLVCFATWLAALWPFRSRAIAVWAMLLYLGSLLPQMGTDASDRCLYFPYIGASILLALLLVSIRPLAKRLAPDAPRLPLWTRIFGWYVLTGVLIPGIIFSAMYPFMYMPSMSGPERESLTAIEHIEKTNPEHVLIMNTSGMFQTFYPPMIIEYYTARPVDVRILNSCNAIVTAKRTGDRSFVIRADRPGWLSNMFARAMRLTPLFEKGRVYEKDLFTATLIDLTPDRRDVLAVQFDMKLKLDDRSVLFLRWDGEAFRPFNLSRMRVGDTVELADTSNLWNM
ncbi:MAG: glycosyltransferase family 39 protein [Pseudomonadota bacterium]